MSSTVPSPAPAVWKRATCPDGINAELRPWLRMTIPDELEGGTIDTVPVGEVLGRSWILLFGLIPVDYDDLRLEEREPGRRFRERSKMGSMRMWQHERIVDPTDAGGCELTDRLAFELRRPLALIPGSRRLARGVVGAIFRRRHRRVAAHFARSPS